MQILRWDVRGWAGVERLTVVNPGRIIELWSEAHGQGKTSALEALLALAGGKGRVVDGMSAVRDGHKRATARLEWNDNGADYIADVSISKSGNMTVTLTDGEGHTIAKPRDALAMIFGRLYSPSDFRDWDVKEQADFCRLLAGDDWAARLAELQAQEKRAAEERTFTARTVKQLGRLEPIAKVERIDVTAVRAELAEVEAQAKRHAGLIAEIARLDDAVRVACNEVRRLEVALDAARIMHSDSVTSRSVFPDPGEAPNPNPLRERVMDAGAINAKADAYDRYLSELARHEDVGAAAAAAESKLADVREELAKHRRDATLPEGLAIADDGLMWNGRPLARASTGEGYRLSFELARAAGQRIVIQDRAESADGGIIAELDAACREADMVAIIATLGHHHTPGALELFNGEVVDPTDGDAVTTEGAKPF